MLRRRMGSFDILDEHESGQCVIGTGRRVQGAKSRGVVRRLRLDGRRNF